MVLDSPDVRIVEFPETLVAVLEHHGPPELEHETARRFVEWRIANRLSRDRHQTYGIHYTDPRITPPAAHRMDICVSVLEPIASNPQGVVNKVIPAGRCAVARHLGSRNHVGAAVYLSEVWLPASGERLGTFPMFFHYVNVGPDIRDDDMITDVYLPLR